MSVSVVAFGALAAGVGGALAPRLIRAVPEPEPAVPPAGEEPRGDEARPLEESAASVAAESAGEPKVLYAEIGGAPGLWWRTALAAGAAGGVVAWTTGWDLALLVLLPLVPIMVALSVIDWRTRLLPTWVIRPTYFLTIGLVVLASLLAGDPGGILRAALGWLALGTFYFVLWFINSGGLGYGDVRLSGILGMAVGWVGWAELITGAWSGFFLGGVVGGLLALLKVVDRRGVPFGPFMVMGVLVGLVLGPWVATHWG